MERLLNIAAVTEAEPPLPAHSLSRGTLPEAGPSASAGAGWDGGGAELDAGLTFEAHLTQLAEWSALTLAKLDDKDEASRAAVHATGAAGRSGLHSARMIPSRS
jgi:hypothetical protein